MATAISVLEQEVRKADVSTRGQQRDDALLTDLYQLTMMAAYSDCGKDDNTATFDMFIRKLPKDWGYFIANGIEDAIDYVTGLNFDQSDIDYLRSQGMFSEDFLDSLANFRFEGDVYAVKEGTVVPENVPVLRVTAPRSQAQLVETRLLNIINFQTMIATKASRVVESAKGKAVVDFGLRRAQEETAGMKGSRAAYVGGCVATSNVKAGKEYGIPIAGTHAHSFVMSFDTEIDAFRAYAKAFPDNTTLLIDTYDVMQGAANAATVAKELEESGHRLKSVRLDSGDLCEDSKRVRRFLDSQGLEYVKIVASNDLNEYKISQLEADGAQMDAYGVGTELITAKPVTAVSGVYKLAEDTNKEGELVPKIKLAEGKRTLPGRKQVYRYDDVVRICEEPRISHYVVALEGEFDDDPGCTPMLEKAVEGGVRVRVRQSVQESQEIAGEQTLSLPGCYTGVHAEPLRAHVSPRLERLADELSQKYGK